MQNMKKERGIIMNKQQYIDHAKKTAKPSPVLKNVIWAFTVGGAICAAAEGLRRAYGTVISEDDAAALTSATLILIAVLLTGFGLFERIAKHAGAGTLVPITGFANAVASCAIDAKSEGFVLGVGAKVFTVAGPVILYGTAAGAAFGVIYFIVGLF